MENSQLSNIVFWIGFSLSVIAIIGDWQSSKDFQYYGLTESNRITARGGFFAVKKNLLFTSAFVAFAAALGLLMPQIRGFVGVFFIIPIITRGVIGWLGNIPAKKKGREKQIIFLRRLHEMVLGGAADDEIRHYFLSLRANQTGGVTYYRLFGWIQSSKTDYEEAIAEVRNDLVNLTATDEKNWFPK